MAQWDWSVEGRQWSDGTLVRSHEESGTVDAEGAGDALRWLLDNGPVWDGLDQRRAVTVSLSPREE